MATNTEEAKEPKPKPSYKWFTPVPQKWFGLIVRGGDLHRIIHGVKGWHVNEDFKFEKGDEELSSPVRAIFGREFVGIPGIQGIYGYKFAWNKFWRKTDATGKEIPEYDVYAHDAETIYFTPFESQYPLQFGGIEVRAKGKEGDDKEDLVSTKEDFVPVTKTEEALIPVTFVITVRVRIIDPETALMTNTDWFGGVLVPNLQKGVKDFAGEKTYDELIRGSKSNVAEEFVEYIMGKKDDQSDFRKNVLNNAGVDIIDVGITDIKPNEEFERALLNLASAQRDALAGIAKAEGRRKEAELDGQGEASKILAIADAENKRIKMTTLLATGGPGRDATIIEKWRQVHGSGVTTYVEAGAEASILVGANGKPIS